MVSFSSMKTENDWLFEYSVGWIIVWWNVLHPMLICELFQMHIEKVENIKIKNKWYFWRFLKLNTYQVHVSISMQNI